MERYLEYNEPPDEKERLRERALAYIDLHMYKEAITEYEKIIQMDSGDHSSYMDLAFAFEKSGEIGKSIECYRNAIKLFPDNSDLYTCLGYCFDVYLKRYDMSIVCFEKALELNPFDEWAIHNVGVNLRKVGKPYEALYYFEEAMDVVQKKGEKPPYNILHNLAWGYCQCKDYKHSLILFDILIREYPDKVSVFTDCVCLYYRVGLWKRALGLLDNMLHQYPEDRHCRRLYKLIRNKIG